MDTVGYLHLMDRFPQLGSLLGPPRPRDRQGPPSIYWRGGSLLGLSHAAGAELGGLKGVRGDASPGNTAEDYFGSGIDTSEYYYRSMQMQQRAMNMSEAGPQEATSLEPTAVMHAVRISATFGLK